MTVPDEDAVVAIARAAAEGEGWPFVEPLSVTRHGSAWHVMTNVPMRGSNVNVWVDATTGAVLKQAFARR
ncbi:hypothetical protein [Plastoroseomonas arctica]|uniref:PepSY domain-containing protein n=1 Tax=Plastoroseomonas arctica TaxID=1509237 RepID=A0AAF1JXB9_9PROT|nr:hypothetical protein [Plastoroseomonas arctica]MBR0656026.1 hypothetical protein [Plastoroseomonas arctica]